MLEKAPAGFVLHAVADEGGRYARSQESLAAAQAGEISADIDAYQLMRGIANLCVGTDNDARYDALRMVELLIAGLLQSRST